MDMERVEIIIKKDRDTDPFTKQITDELAFVTNCEYYGECEVKVGHSIYKVTAEVVDKIGDDGVEREFTINPVNNHAIKPAKTTRDLEEIELILWDEAERWFKFFEKKNEGRDSGRHGSIHDLLDN